MTKDKVIFYVRRARKRLLDYGQQDLKGGHEDGFNEQLALAIALDLVQTARSDNLVFKEN